MPEASCEENDSDFAHVNIGSQQKMAVMDIARLAARVVNYKDETLTSDPSKGLMVQLWLRVVLLP